MFALLPAIRHLESASSAKSQVMHLLLELLDHFQVLIFFWELHPGIWIEEMRIPEVAGVRAVLDALS